MFKKKERFEEYTLNLIKEFKIVESDDFDGKVSMNEATSAIEKAGKYCVENDIHFGVRLSYLGFRDANNNVDKLVKNILFMPVSLFTENLFIKEIKTVNNVIGLLHEIMAENLPDFFYLFSNNIDIDIASEIDMENLPEVNKEFLKMTKEYIAKKNKEWKFGYYEDMSFGVGKTFYIFFSKKDVLEKNLTTLCRFLQGYCEKVLKEKRSYEFLYEKDSEFVLKLFPQILENKELVSDFIANTDKHFINEILTRTNLNKNEIITNAIKLNPNCYRELPSEYQEDADICKTVLTLDFSMIMSVIDNGPINKDDWKEHCISLLNGGTDNE